MNMAGQADGQALTLLSGALRRLPFQIEDGVEYRIGHDGFRFEVNARGTPDPDKCRVDMTIECDPRPSGNLLLIAVQRGQEVASSFLNYLDGTFRTQGMVVPPGEYLFRLEHPKPKVSFDQTTRQLVEVFN